MPRDIQSINHDIAETGKEITASHRAGVSTAAASEKFHALISELKTARRLAAIWQVYFVHAPDANLVKIGATTNLRARLLALQNASPVPLVLIQSIAGGKDEERVLHQRWAHLRSHGEWFEASPELMHFIRTACA